jgi:hypothetical protein
VTISAVKRKLRKVLKKMGDESVDQKKLKLEPIKFRLIYKVIASDRDGNIAWRTAEGNDSGLRT